MLRCCVLKVRAGVTLNELELPLQTDGEREVWVLFFGLFIS